MYTAMNFTRCHLSAPPHSVANGMYDTRHLLDPHISFHWAAQVKAAKERTRKHVIHDWVCRQARLFKHAP